MKTDDFISLLATGVAPVPTHSAPKRFAWALGAGMLGAALIMSAEFGVNPQLGAAAQLPMFWVKLGFVGLMAAAALPMAQRLSTPGMRAGAAAKAAFGPMLAMVLLAALVWFNTPSELRSALVFGETWRTCSLNIVQVAVPVFLGTLWAMKGLAPTRLTQAGASAGLLSGAVGALVYALHCPELAAPFLLVWYSLGILICTGIGAALGPKLLRW
jgi:hypothetical protein